MTNPMHRFTPFMNQAERDWLFETTANDCAWRVLNVSQILDKKIDELNAECNGDNLRRRIAAVKQ